MKDKYLCVLSVIVSAFLVFMCGCGKGTKDREAVKSEMETILDFENWDELALVACSDDFGIAKINSDKKYIKHGEGSVKVTVFSKDKTPSMLVYPGLKPINISDFSGIDIITADIYNDEDRPVEFYMSIDTRAKSGMETDGAVQTFSLGPKSWNKVIYNINGETVSGVINLEEVIHIAFRFDTVKEGYDSYTVYLDNLSVRKRESAAEPPSREEDEIIYFEDERDLGLCNCSTYYFARYLYPITSVNYEKQFVSQGNSSMKAFIPKSDVTVFPMIEILTRGTGVDFKGAKSISMDIYNANNKRLPVDIHIRDYSRTSGAAPKSDLKKQVWLDANSWGTFVFTKEELAKSTVNIEAIEQIAFETIDQNDPLLGGGITYYFDNFKVVK